MKGAWWTWYVAFYILEHTFAVAIILLEVTIELVNALISTFLSVPIAAVISSTIEWAGLMEWNALLQLLTVVGTEGTPLCCCVIY